MHKWLGIVTPWYDHLELMADYEAAVRGATVCIVDNGSAPAVSDALQRMVERLGRGSLYIRNERNVGFASAANQGLAALVGKNRAIVVLNNDIQARGEWVRRAFLDIMERVPRPYVGMIHGITEAAHNVDGVLVRYVEGWCIGARGSVWQRLGFFDEKEYPMAYYEDADLCFRGALAGMGMQLHDWPLYHLSNTTSRSVAGVYRIAEYNRVRFFNRVRRHVRSRMERERNDEITAAECPSCR